MVSESEKQKNLLDLQYQSILNMVNIAVIITATIIISSAVTVWAGQIQLTQFFIILLISISCCFVFCLHFESKRKNIIESVKKLK